LQAGEGFTEGTGGEGGLGGEEGEDGTEVAVETEGAELRRGKGLEEEKEEEERGAYFGKLHAPDHRLPRTDEDVDHRREEEVEVAFSESVLCVTPNTTSTRLPHKERKRKEKKEGRRLDAPCTR
jgi:hypothetical protein